MKSETFPLNEKNVHALISSWSAPAIRMNKNHIVESAGQASRGIYLMKSGLIKLTIPVKDREHIVFIIGDRGIFGLNCLLNIDNSFSFTCLTEVEIIFIPTNIARPLAAPSFIEFSTYHFTLDIHYLKQKVLRDSKKRVDDRIISFLMSVNQADGWLKITRQDIANYANCSKEHALRILSSFKKRGLISTEGHHIKPNQKLIRLKYPDL